MGASALGQSPAELLVIAHPGVPVEQLSRDELAAIFTLSHRRWGSGAPIVPFNADPKAPNRELFDRTVLGMSPDAAARFWVDFRVRGQGTAPRTVPTSTLMARVIARLPGSIGYVPATEPVSGVRVVARVVGGRVLAP
jgi:ABC-type phosphate transport system substrate-binding protein